MGDVWVDCLKTALLFIFRRRTGPLALFLFYNKISIPMEERSQMWKLVNCDTQHLLCKAAPLIRAFQLILPGRCRQTCSYWYAEHFLSTASAPSIASRYYGVGIVSPHHHRLIPGVVRNFLPAPFRRGLGFSTAVYHSLINPHRLRAYAAQPTLTGLEFSFPSSAWNLKGTSRFTHRPA